jgi:hypothetical protein
MCVLSGQKPFLQRKNLEVGDQFLPVVTWIGRGLGIEPVSIVPTRYNFDL